MSSPPTSKSARRFAHNALLLIAVNLLMRAVGVAFNVFVSNRAGSEVMGLYSLLGGVYTLAITLGCAGINLGTTRLVADALGETGDQDAVIGTLSPLCRRVVRKSLARCVLYSLICGMAAGALLFFFAPVVGNVWLGDARTVTALRILALTLPPIALTSCFSGYFTAMRRVAPSAGVGIVAQLIRLALCSYFLSLWLGDGVEATCLALVLGGALGELLGFLLSLIAYAWDIRRHVSLRDTSGENAVIPSPMKKLTGITVPVTLSACLRSGLVTLQHILIPRGLKKSGSSWASALASYGVVHGMVLPVVLFPSAFISSFSGLLVPEIAESYARRDEARISRISERIITPALMFSFGVAGIMSCFSHELGMVIYNSAEAGVYIRMLAPLIPIMYVDSSVDAVLKGMGEQVYSMNVNIIDALCSVILVWVLLPHMGLMGYIVAIYATETLNTTLSLVRMLRISGMRIRLWRLVAGPLLCIIGATCITRVACSLLPLPTADTAFRLTVPIAVCGAIYILLLFLLRVAGREEIRTAGAILPVHR